MTMTVNTGTAKKVSEAFRRVCNMLETPLRMMRRYYSYVLGREVGNVEAKVITEAQLAFFVFRYCNACRYAANDKDCSLRLVRISSQEVPHLHE